MTIIYVYMLDMATSQIEFRLISQQLIPDICNEFYLNDINYYSFPQYRSLPVILINRTSVPNVWKDVQGDGNYISSCLSFSNWIGGKLC